MTTLYKKKDNILKQCFICKKQTTPIECRFYGIDYLAVPDNWLTANVCGLWKNFCEDCIPIYNKEMN